MITGQDDQTVEDDFEDASSESEEFDEEDTVAFKVIGSLKEPIYQSTLKEVAESLRRDEDVPIDIIPEPNNPWDKKAIAFVCTLDKKQQRIGYVVRECVNAVHNALSNGSVKKTKFAWCKYRTFNGHLGYYAAVNITKMGKWPDEVHHSKSS